MRSFFSLLTLAKIPALLLNSDSVPADKGIGGDSMIASQQPIILGRGFSSHWQQNAPKVGTRVNAVVVEMEGNSGILDVDGHLMRIETQLPLQKGKVIPLS